MHLLLLLSVLAATNGVTANKVAGIRHTSHTKAVHDYLDRLALASKNVILHELMGPTVGSDVTGVMVPVVPDPEHPEYTAYWVRDGCRVYHTWLNGLTVPGRHDDTTLLRALVDDGVHALIRTQHVVSLSGNVFTGGLEEPVFDIHLNKLSDPASRIGSPAADGPPFRAAVLIKYADWLLEPEQNNGTWVSDVLWPAINLDLQWIAMHWNQSSWDLWWPPVWGGSYWTASLQYRAIKAGARLSRNIGRDSSALGYEIHASMILDYLQTFWNEEEGYMSETTVTDIEKGGRSGKGSVPVSVAVLNFDPSLGCDSTTFQPCSDRALSSLKVLGDTFKDIFPIAEHLSPDQPSALFGAFYEEQVFGGHAHYFATLHASEQIFDALMTWDLLGELQIANLSLKFFQQFDRDVKTGTYKKGSEVYEGLTYALTSWAERTLLFLAEHMPEDYVLPMAIDRTTGLPVGPRGTIHCVVAAISVYDAYNGLIPPSWAHGASSRFSSKRRWDDTTANDYHVANGFGHHHHRPWSGNQFHVGFHG